MTETNKKWHLIYLSTNDNKDQIHRWLEEQWPDGVCDIWIDKHKCYFFSCAEDAMAFKLRWA